MEFLTSSVGIALALASFYIVGASLSQRKTIEVVKSKQLAPNEGKITPHVSEAMMNNKSKIAWLTQSRLACKNQIYNDNGSMKALLSNSTKV